LRDSTVPADELVSRYLPGMHSESATQEVRDELATIMSDFHLAVIPGATSKHRRASTRRCGVLPPGCAYLVT